MKEQPMAGTAMRKEQFSLEHVASQIASLQEVLNLTEEQVSSKEKINQLIVVAVRRRR